MDFLILSNHVLYAVPVGAFRLKLHSLWINPEVQVSGVRLTGSSAVVFVTCCFARFGFSGQIVFIGTR